ncbi:MAG: hypothetical protein LN573_05945 [Rickettsia endosymbiont of Oxypoda opaca]|nr:hypothetical protein [Rickettsia endosymbiont of Oxypoda opaca]
MIEKSLLEIIKEKLAKIEQEGNLEKLQEIFRNKVRQKIANPIEVSNITIATENSSRFYDPTIVQKEAIKDHRGKIIVEAGTKINPLDKIEWGQALIFIDGKNSEQIAWAKSKLGKLTLIKGSPIDLSKELNRPIYFDQGGALVKRFNIKSVPAVIIQEGKLLKIMEVAL